VRITFDSIGFVKTDAQKVPRHWTLSKIKGRLLIDEKYLDGLKDIAEGQRIVVIFHFHRSPKFSPGYCIQSPRHLQKKMGVFSICSPIRPNPIGMSVLKVLQKSNNVIHVENLDMEDGTPILDIKPYVDEKTGPPVKTSTEN
jgi:tRNA (adenine37-N6)-methyltransferase